jgi:hypothetical protein
MNDMPIGDLFSKTKMLRPITQKIFPSQEQQVKKKEMDLIAKRNELDAMKMDREKKFFEMTKK